MHELKDGMDYDGPLGPVFRYSADFLGISPFAYMWTDRFSGGNIRHTLYQSVKIAALQYQLTFCPVDFTCMQE
ncbi:MAG: hypothetical protein O2V44_10420 [Candidatus Bathyarchaeota archaeon]|nr:hypothetical protein [Candidatus Bathyarchaeota archaeon]